MKKLFCFLLIGMLTLFSAVFAENQPLYHTFVLTLSDVSVEMNGESFVLAPQMIVTLGMTEDKTDGFVSIDIRKNDETLAAFWAEETENGLQGRYGFSNGDTCGVAVPGSYLHWTLMLMLGMPTDNETGDLSNFLNQVSELLSSPDFLPSGLLLASDDCCILQEGDDWCVFQSTIMGVAAKGTLSWEILEKEEKPFDLSDKREVSYSPMKGLFATEGFEEAQQEILARLIREETIANLFEALQSTK